MLVVATGHRPQSLPGGFKNRELHQRIKKWINRKFLESQADYAISGMAIGMDQWFAEECIALNIPFTAALPFEGQENKWPPRSQEHYRWLLSKATKIVYVDREPGYISDSVSPGVYHPYKMLKRNEWMVDQLKEGDKIFSLFKGGEKGGTYQCLKYAKRVCSGVYHCNLNPENMQSSGKLLVQMSEDFDDVPF